MFMPTEGSYIDLILTRMPHLHIYTQVFETRMRDRHPMIHAMLKSTHTKLELKVLRKRQCKNFSKESFLKDF